MVEGGGTVIRELLRLKLADELKVFVGNIIIGGDGPALSPRYECGARAATMSLADGAGLRLAKETPMDGGVLLEFERA
jgi:riboflavin biosynthesis pyrimidine reductase